MPLPSREEALERIHNLAEHEAVEVSRNARKDMGNLGYVDADACDMLFELEPECWRRLEPGHWNPEHPVGTFVTSFLSRQQEDATEDAHLLFVEVAIRYNDLYLLACKLDGSPR